MEEFTRLYESSLDCKVIKLVNAKGNQHWIFTGRNEAKVPILWPPDAKNWLIRKDPDVGKDGRQQEKGITEDEMVGSHHWLDGYEFEEALGISGGQGSLACCSPRGPKSQTWLNNWTYWLYFCGNNKEKILFPIYQCNQERLFFEKVVYWEV